MLGPPATRHTLPSCKGALLHCRRTLDWPRPASSPTMARLPPAPSCPQGPTGSTDSWFEGTSWANPDTRQLRQLMRWLYDNPDKGRRIGEAARKHIQRNYDNFKVRSCLGCCCCCCCCRCCCQAAATGADALLLPCAWAVPCWGLAVWGLCCADTRPTLRALFPSTPPGGQHHHRAPQADQAAAGLGGPHAAPAPPGRAHVGHQPRHPRLLRWACRCCCCV